MSDLAGRSSSGGDGLSLSLVSLSSRDDNSGSGSGSVAGGSGVGSNNLRLLNIEDTEGSFSFRCLNLRLGPMVGFLVSD